MPVVQISQIKHRRGTNENLPQLASAELGWSVDTRQLYIGNGTLEEGAPEVGNTEILTEHSTLPGVPTEYSQVLEAGTSPNIAYAYFDDSNPGVTVNYTITRGDNVRTGAIRASQLLSSLAYDEEFTETADVGVTFTFTQISNVYSQLSATITNSAPYVDVDANLIFAASTFTF